MCNARPQSARAGPSRGPQGTPAGPHGNNLPPRTDASIPCQAPPHPSRQPARRTAAGQDQAGTTPPPPPRSNRGTGNPTPNPKLTSQAGIQPARQYPRARLGFVSNFVPPGLGSKKGSVCCYLQHSTRLGGPRPGGTKISICLPCRCSSGPKPGPADTDLGTAAPARTPTGTPRPHSYINISFFAMGTPQPSHATRQGKARGGAPVRRSGPPPKHTHPAAHRSKVVTQNLAPGKVTKKTW